MNEDYLSIKFMVKDIFNESFIEKGRVYLSQNCVIRGNSFSNWKDVVRQSLRHCVVFSGGKEVVDSIFGCDCRS